MALYSKDTPFYNISGPGLIEGKYGVPRLTYYTSFGLNSDEPKIVDGKVSQESSYPGNFIFVIPVEIPGADDIIAAVYNRSAAGEANNPDIFFHQTSKALRVSVAVGAGAAVAAAELALLFGTAGASTAAGAAIKSTAKTGATLAKGLAKNILKWSIRPGKRSLLASKRALETIFKMGANIPKLAGPQEEAIKFFAGSGVNLYRNYKRIKPATSILQLGAGVTAGLAGISATGILISAIPGATGYAVYSAIMEYYSDFLNPYKIRSYYKEYPKTASDYASKAVQTLIMPSSLLIDSRETPSNNKHSMPWYTIVIKPSQLSSDKNFLNKNGGLSTWQQSNFEAEKLMGVSNKGTIEQTNKNTIIKSDTFYLDFYKPIDFITIVKIIQMLGVESATYNKFIPHKSNIEGFVTQQALTPILEALKKTSQYQTLKKINKYLDKNATPSQALLDSINNGTVPPGAINENGIYAAKIATKAYIKKLLELEDNRFTEERKFELASQMADLLAYDAEIEDLEDFQDRLKADIEKIFVGTSVQDNMNKGTIFGQFCVNYLNVFKTLSAAWPGSSKTSKSIKKKKDNFKQALLSTTPNLAKLGDLKEAQLAGNRILKIPFKKTANFEAHADFKSALSVLDEMRSETAGHLFDKQIDIEQIADAAPVPEVDDFVNSLRSLTPEQRASLRKSLLIRKQKNLEKSGKILQNIKKMQFSPKFLGAAALCGVQGLFPLRTNNGIVEVPSINIESVTDIINNSINTQLNMVQNQVLNTMNSAANVATDTVTAGVGLLADAGIDFPLDASFIQVNNNSYGQKVSQQMDDIKKILTKPQETVNKVKTIKQDSISIMKQYMDLCEELQKVQLENVKIDAYIAAINQADISDKKADYKKIAEDAKGKIDATIVKKEDIVNQIKDSVNGIGSGINNKSRTLAGKINSYTAPKPALEIDQS